MNRLGRFEPGMRTVELASQSSIFFSIKKRPNNKSQFFKTFIPLTIHRVKVQKWPCKIFWSKTSHRISKLGYHSFFFDFFTHHPLSHDHHTRINKYISLTHVLVSDYSILPIYPNHIFLSPLSLSCLLLPLFLNIRLFSLIWLN